jgi:hypothetical protein
MKRLCIFIEYRIRLTAVRERRSIVVMERYVLMGNHIVINKTR